MSHWHHKTINLALIPPAAYSQFPQFITREHHQRFQFAPASSIHYTRIQRFQFAPASSIHHTRIHQPRYQFHDPRFQFAPASSIHYTRIHHPRFQFAPASSIHHMRIHHPRFQFAKFITRDSNSPQPPQFITCERFQFAPASSIHHMRIHHSRFQFAEFITPIPIRPSLLNSSHANSSPAISICPSLLNSSHANSSPAIPICCIIIHVQLRSFAPTSAHSPLPPLIQPCLLASNSLLYVYNNKIMTLSPTILPIIR